jgi:serine/threonine protein phosphatase PrpC
VETILLLGRDHTELGDAATETVGPVSAALTRGRHPKAFPYTEPNEDALCAAVTDEMVLLAVADGHHGTDASHTAITKIASTIPTLDRSQAAYEAVSLAATAIVSLPVPTDAPPGTTLTVVSITDATASFAGWGDSAAFHLRGRRLQPILDRKPVFGRSGDPTPPHIDQTTVPLQAGDLLGVATDGLFDFLPSPWPRTLGGLLADTDPTAGVARAVAAAGDGGGGDNLAIVVYQHCK